MSKQLIITKFDIAGHRCVVTAVMAADRVIELSIHKDSDTALLGNIYIGKVQKIVPSLKAAFIDIAPGKSCYYQLDEKSSPYFTSVKKDGKIKAGDELLVQVQTEALKSKVPAVTGNLNLPGHYLVLTTGTKKLGLSARLKAHEKEHIKAVLLPVMPNDCGVVVRTNARDADPNELLEEMDYLYQRMKKILKTGQIGRCYSLIETSPPEYIRILNDIDSRELDRIVTDDPNILSEIKDFLLNCRPACEKTVHYYEDSLLQLYKCYSLESILEHALKEKVWMKSGAFLMIQQTEAFVAIDVNSGKSANPDNAFENYRKINLEAAKEIACQLRLRNLSGIILIDFINMTSSEHQQELIHTLNGYLKQDPVKSVVVDITGLQIMEVTRKKVRKSLSEQLAQIKISKEEH